MFKGEEDALRVSIFGIRQEFNIVRLNGKPCLSNEVLWTALSHLAKSLAPFVALSNLGLLSLCASLKFVAVLLIASSRVSGSSEMRLKAVAPRMGRGMNTGGVKYF